MKCVLPILACLFLTACAHRTAPPLAPRAPQQQDFVDLVAGTRVKVVIPLLRSGGYILPSLKAHGEGMNRTIETGGDFLGYEKAFYRVRARPRGGIAIRFDYADVWEQGKTRRVRSTRLPLFDEAAGARYVRLVFVTRLSNADHDMAIVAANEIAAFDAATRAITDRADCRSNETTWCRWVPNGVAVTPEKR